MEQRRLNVTLFGAFAFIIGAMFLVMAGTLSKLYKEMAIKWLPPMVSRLPEKEEHEKVDFIFYCIRDEDHDDPNQANLFPGI